MNHPLTMQLQYRVGLKKIEFENAVSLQKSHLIVNRLYRELKLLQAKLNERFIIISIQEGIAPEDVIMVNSKV